MMNTTNTNRSKRMTQLTATRSALKEMADMATFCAGPYAADHVARIERVRAKVMQSYSARLRGAW